MQLAATPRAGQPPQPSIGAPPGGAPTPLGVATSSALELRLTNCSDRYFRAWLARLPGELSSETAVSAVVVLEPGDDARLLCSLAGAAAAAATQGGSSGGGSASSSGGMAPAESRASAHVEPGRMACSERLSSGLGVCWQMITGDVAPDKLPKGLVRLPAVDVARSLTPGVRCVGGDGGVAGVGSAPASAAAVALRPVQGSVAAAAVHVSASFTLPPLSFRPFLARRAPSHPHTPPPCTLAAAVSSIAPSQLRLSFVLPAPRPGGPPQPPLSDLIGAAQQLQLRLGPVIGPLWGVRAAVGQPLELELQLEHLGQAGSSSGGGGGGGGSGEAGGGGCEAAASMEAVELSLMVAELGGGSGEGESPLAEPFTPLASSTPRMGGDGGVGGGGGGGGIDAGMLLTGCCERLQLSVAPGGRAAQRLCLLGVAPGLYQLGVARVVSWLPEDAGRRLHCTIDRLYIGVV